MNGQQGARLRKVDGRGSDRLYGRFSQVSGKISSWAAILFAPTLVGTIYGTNFEDMPELKWAGGHPFAILLMAVVCVSLYVIFKKRDWL